MTTISISLPDPIKDFIEAQVASGAFGTPSELVCKLIQDAIEREEVLRLLEIDKPALEAKLLEGLNSGPPIEATPEFWADRRQKLAGKKQA